MGDATSGPVRLSFNPQLRVEFRGATVTSDAGVLLPRELDERLRLCTLIDPRTGHNRQCPLPDLFRQSIYSRLAAYEDTNDAERLAEDPTFRMLASRERRETSVALTSTLQWFETEVLGDERNYQGLSRLNAELVQREASGTRRVTLDIDSSESPVHGPKSSPPTTATSSPSAITRSSSSTRTATAWPPRSGRATSTVRTGGIRSSSPSLTGTGPGDRSWSSAPTRPLLSRPCTRRWNDGVRRMPSASRPTLSWSGPSRACSPGHAADRATPRWCATGAFGIGPRPETGRGG